MPCDLCAVLDCMQYCCLVSNGAFACCLHIVMHKQLSVGSLDLNGGQVVVESPPGSDDGEEQFQVVWA